MTQKTKQSRKLASDYTDRFPDELLHLGYTPEQLERKLQEGIDAADEGRVVSVQKVLKKTNDIIEKARRKRTKNKK